MAEHIVKCRNLSIGYGNEIVLQGINLEIAKGDYLPFVGYNGAGKTTLLRTILGLLKPLGGELMIAENHVPGYVAQVSTLDKLYPVTARQIVHMGFYPKIGFWQQPGSALIERAEKLLCRFNLQDHADRPFEELSGGMRQKVLIARALVTNTDLLIMDEPATGLDEKSEFELIELLFQLSEKEGKTVLFAQHNLAPILFFAKKICHFNQGRVELVSMADYQRSSRLSRPDSLKVEQSSHV